MIMGCVRWQIEALAKKSAFEAGCYDNILLHLFYKLEPNTS